jgi:hypothetical protein
MLIQVTQEDIELGIAGDCEHCPIARALWRATGRWWFAGIVKAWPAGGDCEPVVPLPGEAQRFAIALDRSHTVEPFAFEFPWEG